MPAAPRPVRALAAAARAVVVAAVLIAATVAGMTHDAPVGGWVTTDTAARDAAMTRGPANVPTFTTATPLERTGCSPMTGGRPATVPAALLLSDRDGVVSRVPFTARTVAGVRGSGVGAAAVYVIGMCTTLTP